VAKSRARFRIVASFMESGVMSRWSSGRSGGGRRVKMLGFGVSQEFVNPRRSTAEFINGGTIGRRYPWPTGRPLRSQVSCMR
jgi:hypothetical protein